MLQALLPLLGFVIVGKATDTTKYVVVNHGRPAGEMLVIHHGDSVVVRYRHVDRNRGVRSETRYRLSPAGDVVAAEFRPLTLDGQAAGPSQGFEIVGDSLRWTGVASGGGGRGASEAGGVAGGPPRPSVRVEPGTFYRVGGSTPFDQALLARYLLRQPQRRAKVYPNATASVEIVAETSVKSGARNERVRLAMVSLPSGTATPVGVWLDAKNELVASDVQWFIAVRPGAEGALPGLRAIEIKHRNDLGDRLSRRLTPSASGTLVLRNGDVFDSERAVVMPRTTVVIRGDRIVAVGPADSVAIPAGATIIDASGKTVIPGMWDMHTHFQLNSQSSGSLLQLATGITTIRDLASDVDIAVSHRDRANAGRLVSPRVILAGFLEGPGAWAGPSDVLVRTEDEARAWIARYDSLGYRQIKVYNLVHPDLVPSIALEAHRRGMRLSGHVPRGMSVPAAIALGFDEINHAAFLFSTFYPDSFFLPTMRAYSAVAAAVARNINVDGPEMTALIQLLRKSGTVIDGTFNIWQGSGALGGREDPAAAAYGRLLKRLYDAGVTLVPGTDNSLGTTYVTELELYEHDGIPAPNVLQIATIVPARVMKDDKEYGSIAPGKVADLVIVNGRPAERISDLQKVEQVVRAGRVYNSRDLRAALGVSPR